MLLLPGEAEALFFIFEPICYGAKYAQRTETITKKEGVSGGFKPLKLSNAHPPYHIVNLLTPLFRDQAGRFYRSFGMVDYACICTYRRNAGKREFAVSKLEVYPT